MLLNKYLRIRRIVRSAAVYSAGEHSFWRAETQLATEPWSWNRCHQVWHTNWRNIVCLQAPFSLKHYFIHALSHIYMYSYTQWHVTINLAQQLSPLALYSIQTEPTIITTAASAVILWTTDKWQPGQMQRKNQHLTSIASILLIHRHQCFNGLGDYNLERRKWTSVPYSEGQTSLNTRKREHRLKSQVSASPSGSQDDCSNTKSRVILKITFSSREDGRHSLH